MTNRHSSWLLAVAVAVALVLTAPSAAFATEQAPGSDYVALGDSYSAGVGAGDYDRASGVCQRSAVSYPELWAKDHEPSSFAFVACSGARTDDVLADQLDALDHGTDLVSITVGGNNAGFGEVMTTCVLKTEAACTARIDTARGHIADTLPAELDEVYEAVRERAPQARVVVLGYPRFYRLQGTCVVGLSEAKRGAINTAAELLNEVTAKRAADHGFTFVDAAAAFTGHEICSGSSWLHSLSPTRLTDSYHPTAPGQSGGYLPAFTAVAS
ncbi:SGNH/GDSL hydrolase family protein [Streptomyces sp. ODS05-4]|uniref:SGNH/GDSL hydrolase family protein n=1 Tax=Streptomyces sp. ODS05-4 TaxID=2944939 RepID=UPI00210D9B4E|nr:SGNH/GDSL hydrolase family protein [Streptomyces sp. ODS05-4]